MQNDAISNLVPAHRDKCSLERVLAASIGEVKSAECMERLLSRYGRLTTVFSAEAEEISRVGRVNMNAALLIKLVAYLNSRRVTEHFKFGVSHTEVELREYIAALFLGLSVETVYALILDDKDRVIATELISEGTVNASDVVPRKILECARRKRSTSVILAHNHPKGSITASKDDIMTTGRLFNLFATVGVRLRAHYIVADGEIGRIDTDMLYSPNLV